MQDHIDGNETISLLGNMGLKGEMGYERYELFLILLMENAMRTPN